ncbi:MAG TPA: hypothetical protein GXX42_03975 [Petrimonas sp.]|uniref:DUF6266 family protein n=1 Tax=Petrimonas sp. TaxID=2023866 RepID=UPI0017527139|nr:hypothetical protein [Petrimonas sp.]
MATIKQGILGGFSGKVGTVVGGTWKGIHYMRSLPTSVRNPRTEAQMKQRTKFLIIINFLKPITPFIRTGFKAYANKQTAFNAAMSYNVSNAISGDFPDFKLDYPNALVSRGSLLPAEDATATVAEDKMTFAWADNSGTSNAQATDKAMALMYNSVKGEAVFDTASAERSAKTANLAIPAGWTGDTVEIYLGFVSEDGSLIANSVYLGQKPIA